MKKQAETTSAKAFKTLIICVQAPYNTTRDIAAYFQEFKNLVKTSRDHFDEEITIKLRSIDPAYFLTKGKVQEVKALCEQHNIEVVIFSDALSAQQERNLSKYLDCVIIDRTHLILEIFETAAQSAEGKLQVGIAVLKHKRSRLSGKGLYLAQQRGNIGMRAGPGEKAKVREARHIDQLILKHTRELARLEQVRHTQRKRRLESQLPHIALVGYTNAGKSTILNALTKADVLVEDKPFATLDTTTRSLFINGQKTALISDTVGFIQQLPHHLIDAFKSTLSELQFADLLLHVVDLSDINWKDHLEIVHLILKELALDKPILYVFNKIDKQENIDALQPYLDSLQPHILISAKTKEGIQPLVDFLIQWKPSTAESKL